ncbi:hypothetical protein ACFVXB_37380, partial [Streptomyces sp. NPDC058247]
RVFGRGGGRGGPAPAAGGAWALGALPRGARSCAWTKSRAKLALGPTVSLPPQDRPTAKRESPQFTGRVIAALYSSPELAALSGRALIGAELGSSLSVTDIDGGTPRSTRHVLGGPPEPHPSLLG